MVGKRGLGEAELGWSGKGAGAAKVLEWMNWCVLTQQSLAPPLPFHPHGCSPEGRQVLLSCTFYKPERFSFQISNVWILNSL